MKTNILLFLGLFGLAFGQGGPPGLDVVHFINPGPHEVVVFWKINSDPDNNVTIPAGETHTFSHNFLTGDDSYEWGYRDPFAASLIGNSYVGDGAGESRIVVGSAAGTSGYHEVTLPLSAGRLPNDDAKKTLWLVEDTDLTAAVFREGIDKLAGASSAGGGTGDPAASSQRETLAGLHLQVLEDYEVTHEAIEAASADARTAAQDSVTQTTPTLGTVTELSTSSIFSIQLGSTTLDLDPANSPQVVQVCAFLKTVSGWAMLVYFGLFTWNHFNKIVLGMMPISQAKGNPIVGGTGAQATALVAAGIITTILVGVPAIYWTFINTDLAFDWSALSSNPFNGGHGSIVSAGLYILGLVFPYSLALYLLSQVFLVLKFGATMILGVNAATKFIVP